MPKGDANSMESTIVANASVPKGPHDTPTRRWGIEYECLRKCNRQIPSEISVYPEVFPHIIEIITPTCGSIEEAKARLSSLLAQVRQHITLGEYAVYESQAPKVGIDDITGANKAYYLWILEDMYRFGGYVPEDFLIAGTHINYSNRLFSDDDSILAAGLIRNYSWMLVTLGSNSPFMGGRASGYLSSRTVFMPNRYDIPQWHDFRHFLEWLEGEKRKGRIFRGKDRTWTPVCPRLHADRKSPSLNRIEIRSLDGGLGVTPELIAGCCRLIERLISTPPQITAMPTPDEVRQNDMQAATRGQRARITFDQKLIDAKALLREYCEGIPVLEQVLEEGNPAEQALVRFREGRALQ